MRRVAHNSITTAPQSPAEDRKHRMIDYSIMMGIRILCIIAVFIVPGWWRLLPCAGAIFLPYFAVVIANVTSRRIDPPQTVPSIEIVSKGGPQ